MRLPNAAHTSRPWRIHELMQGFRLEDVWELPTPGRKDEFPLLVEGIAAGSTSETPTLPARALWAIRWKLGELFGWDRPEDGLGSRVQSLREQLPEDLREAPRGPDGDPLPFRSLYLLEDEWATELANRTVHGVMHVGWVEGDPGVYRGQMAVYVKPNGLLGEAYMVALRPFRHLVVYPPLMRQIEDAWDRRGQVRPATLA